MSKIATLFDNDITRQIEEVHPAVAGAMRHVDRCKMLTWSRALLGLNWSARPTRAVDNKSLDASRISGLLIDSLRLTKLRAAASTQPFGARSS